MAEEFSTGVDVPFTTGAVRLPPILAIRSGAIFLTIYVYLKELISIFTLLVLVHSIASTLILIIFYVAIIFFVGLYTICYWGEQGANLKAAVIGKEIEKAQRRFDLKMAELLLAVQASVARVEALIAYRSFLSNHELMGLYLAEKFLVAPESGGLEAKLVVVSKMMEMIPSGGGRNNAGIVQLSVGRDGDPSTPTGDVTASSSGKGH